MDYATWCEAQDAMRCELCGEATEEKLVDVDMPNGFVISIHESCGQALAA